MSEVDIPTAQPGEPFARVRTATVGGLQVESVSLLGLLEGVSYDNLALGYTGTQLTSVVYKLGSSTVATLTLGYTGALLTSVVRS